MSTFLWVLQGVLAALFLTAGTLKLTRTREKLETFMPWVQDYATPAVRRVGVAEILGATGLILPAALDILVWLTPLAAAGLATLMALAGIHHARKGEWSDAGFNAVLFAAALVVAIFRFGPNAF